MKYNKKISLGIPKINLLLRFIGTIITNVLLKHDKNQLKFNRIVRNFSASIIIMEKVKPIRFNNPSQNEFVKTLRKRVDNYFKEKNIAIMVQLKELVDTFVEVASQHTQTLIPGMTHLQHAQPINFGYHMLAYANMFKRDYERFESSYVRNDVSPLGSAALAGTPQVAALGIDPLVFKLTVNPH